MRRKRSRILGCLALLLALPAVGAGAQGWQVRATYLANEGVLLAAGDSKVLIDALFGQGLSGYPVAEETERQRMEAAQGPYADVDLVLATHYHGDHFDSQAVASHLAHNPHALFVSTDQAVTRLRRDVEDFAAIEDRARAAVPAEGQQISLRHRGIALRVFNLHHGRHRRPPVENLGFLVRLGGRSILHVGDTEATPRELRASGALDKPIDLALVPFWHLTGSWTDLLRLEVRPSAIAAMHLPAPDAPASYFGAGGDLESLTRTVRESFPGAHVLTRSAQSLTLGPTD